MDKSQIPSVGELKKELRRIDENLKEKCALCRIVLGLSMIIFIAVSLYALVDLYNKKYNFKTVPLDPALYPPVDPAVSDREIFELAQLFHPEIASTTVRPSVSSSTDTLSN